jgi:hypothetical protein
MTLLDVLVEKKLITKTDVATVKQEVESGAVTLESALHERGITDEQILKIKSEIFEIPIRNLASAEEFTQRLYS